MNRRDISLTIALCASLVTHALLLGAAAEMYNHFAGYGYLPGYNLEQQGAIAQGFLPDDEQDPWKRLGDAIGSGQAIMSSPGEQPLQAPQASQDQPFLSLDPAGVGEVGNKPSESVLPVADSVQAPPTPPQPPLETATPFGFGDHTEQVPQRLVKNIPQTPQVQATGSAPPADPAPEAESESDPTSVAGFADFRPGATDVRIGRKFKLIRPRLSLAGRADLLTLRSSIVVLKIRLDETGKVTSAEIFRSSGSNEVDQPCQLAAYDWWFEPLKDRSGKPMKDVILFTIRFL